MAWPCFWVEPTFEAEIGLRRFSYGTGAQDCASGYHSAMVFLDERVPVSIVTSEDGHKHWDYVQGDNQPYDDPRWPTTCEKGCGYVFTDTDNWQGWTEPLYRRTDTGELRVQHWNIMPQNAPTLEPGAMWHAFWREEYGPLNPDKPQDGIVLLVRCPYMDDRSPERGGQDWCVDAPSTGSGGFWTRVGDPRQPETLTVTPSIAIGLAGQPGFYHGFLRDGVLTDHLGG